MHMVVAPPPVPIVGKAFTVIVRVVVFTHPLALIPVMVYVVVAVALQVTLAPVVALSPAAGDQL